MLKRTMTYTDFDGNERTEDFYFNLSKAELLEMEFEVGGNLAERIKTIVAAKDVKRVGEVFKDILLKAYGEKSSDGKRFMKSKEISDAFVQTEAYSDLFVELATNGDSAAAFIKGIMPQQLLNDAT